MKQALIDSSYFIALDTNSDQNHDAAIRHWRTIRADMPQLVVTSFILDETVTYFNSRRHHAKAVQVGNNLLHSPSIQFVHVDTALFLDGWTYFQSHQDKDYSLTDCISFVLMQNLAITTAFTFDKHFAQAGFTIEP